MIVIVVHLQLSIISAAMTTSPDSDRSKLCQALQASLKAQALKQTGTASKPPTTTTAQSE